LAVSTFFLSSRSADDSRPVVILCDGVSELGFEILNLLEGVSLEGKMGSGEPGVKRSRL